MNNADTAAHNQGACSSVRASEEGPQGVFVLICPSVRDDRELARLDRGGMTILRHEYASLQLEEIAGAGAKVGPLRNPLTEVDAILAKLQGQTISGVISTDDYPGSTLACIIAQRLGLPAPSPAVNLLCQHKYHARLAQKALVPEAVPNFAAIDVSAGPKLPLDILPPFFLKPVKSFFSIGALRVDTLEAPEAVEKARTRWRNMEEFFRCRMAFALLLRCRRREVARLGGHGTAAPRLARLCGGQVCQLLSLSVLFAGERASFNPFETLR